MAKRKSKIAEDELHQRIRENLRTAIDAEKDNRALFLEDTKFENGDEETIWGADTLEERKGRPCPCVNRAREVSTQVCGQARQNEIGVSVLPDGSRDESMEAENKEIADILEGIIRDIEVESNAKSAYDYAHSCSVRGGIGYFRILTDYIDDDSDYQTIFIKRIVNPLSVYFDPGAKEIDRSDAMWAYITDTMTRKEFERKYPKSSVVSSIERGEGDFEATWISDKTVTIAEYFEVIDEDDILYRLDGDIFVRQSEIDRDNGKIEETAGRRFLVVEDQQREIVSQRKTKKRRIEWRLTNGYETLEGPKPWPGKYIGICTVLGDEVWIDGKQVLRSAIRFVKDPVRAYNWGLAQAMETMSMTPKQPILVSAKAIGPYKALWDQAHTTPLPYLPYDPQPGEALPQRAQGSYPDSGAQSIMSMTIDDIKATSNSFNASSGEMGSETSGRAIIARQRQLDNGTFAFHDGLVTGVQYGYKVIMDLIPHILDTQRRVRIRKSDGTELYATINEKSVDPVTGKETVKNDITTGKYRVVAKASLAYATRRMEAADGMIQLTTAAPQFAPIIAPRLAKNLDWPEADEIAEEMQKMVQGPKDTPPDPRPQMMAEKHQLDMESKGMDIEKKKVEFSKSQDQAMQQMASVAQQVTIMTLQQLGIIPPPDASRG